MAENLEGVAAPEIDVRGGGLGTVPIKTTRQDEILMHWVSDGDLNDLAYSRTGWLENLLWAMVGATVGAVIPAVEELYTAYWSDQPTPVGGLALMKILIFFITLGLAILAAVVVYRKGKTGRQILDEIRKRPKYETR